MSRDLHDLNYLADLEDPQGENFVPADYNTQDMRNINEKVNRILYGDNSSFNKTTARDSQVDINSANPSKNELNSFSNQQKREQFKMEAEDYLHPNYNKMNKNDTKDTKNKKNKGNSNKKDGAKTTRKKAIVASVVAVSVLLCVTLGLVIQAVVMPNNSILAKLGIISNETAPVIILNGDGEFVFADDCKVSGLSIGGMTVSEAKKALQPKELAARPDMNITVTVDDDTNVFTQNNFTFTYNTDEILAKEKEFSEKLSQGVTYPTQEDEKGNTYIPQANFEIKATLNDTSVDKLVKKLGKKYDVKAENARVVSFNPDAKNMFEYQEGVDGKELDEASIKEKLNSIIQTGKSTGNYTGEIVENTVISKPKADIAFLKKNIVLLAKWETYSTNNANGNKNMTVSLKACDGSVIEPGEQWSFNDCTGDSNDPANGYAEAGVIINGSYTNGYGGGICQSSTTIYNAAVRSNLGILERHPHTFPSSYAYSGFDAAIDYGNLDLKLQNNSEYQVFLSCYMSGSTLYASFYGVKDDSYDTIDTYSENYNITSSSYRSRSYRIYLNKKGKEIDREELPSSYYSLQGGHSVQAADSGNGNYSSGGRPTGGDRNVNSVTSSSTSSSRVSSQRPSSSSSRVTQTTTVPKTTSSRSVSSKPQPTTKKPVNTKPTSSASSKPASSASSVPSEDSESSETPEIE